jgi:RNA polymerase sigma-70 factor (ECF subfamily)
MLANATILAADNSLTDDLIISRILLGKREYYEILVRRYNNLFYRTAKGILSEEEDVEDVMQEAYIRGYEKLHQFRKEARFSTWLGRILINCALQHLNSAKKKNQVSIDAVKGEELIDFSENENDSTTPEVRDNLKKAIESAITQLPSKYRVVFILREIEQVSVSDTATMLDISEENVKVRLHRAKTMLKEMLRSHVAALDIFPFHADRCGLIANAVMNHINSTEIFPFGNVARPSGS